MKQLTALFIATVILFSLSGVAWAEGEAVSAEPIVVPDNPAGETVEEIPENAAMNNNLGTVVLNDGRLEMNHASATVETNAGTVSNNYGTVCVNDIGGTVSQNQELIQTNDGYVEFNADRIEINSGTVDYNIGKVIVNDGFVIDSGKYGTAEVTYNTGVVQCDRSPDEVKYNAGVIFQYTPNGDDFDKVIHYGVAYSLTYTPEELNVMLLNNPSDAYSILTGEVHSGHSAFTEAVYKSGYPEVNGVINLLTEEDLPEFQMSRCYLASWRDVNHDNAAYAPGEQVTVTAPLWLMPYWELIPDPSTTVEPEADNTAAAPSYYLVPASTEQTESWNLFNVSVTSADSRVTKDSVLPAAALRLSADLAEVLRYWTLRIEFDGEVLPSDSYSLSFHQDGTATLLFSRTFLRTQSAGEHEITLLLHDAEINVTILLTEPTPEETSLRARKAQLSGAFSNMPKSSAASQKGKSG